MKKYNINQEIPVPPSIQEQEKTDNPLEHMLSSIDHQHEFSEEDRRLTAKIEEVRLLASRLEDLVTSNDATCEKFGEHAQTLSSAANRLDEQVSGLNTIVIPAKLTPESFQELEKFVDGLIQKEKALLEIHRRQQRQEWESCNDHLKSIIRDNKGVWLSNKVFWWAIGIFEVVACLAIYFGGNALIAVFR